MSTEPEAVEWVRRVAEHLGFSNRWYRAAVSAANTFRLSGALTIRLATGPCFLATKICVQRSGRGWA